MQDCGLNCHEKCRELAPKTCTKYKAMSSKDPTVSDQLSDAAPGLGAAGADRWGHYHYYRDYYYIITIVLLLYYYDRWGQDSLGYSFSPGHQQQEQGNITMQVS